MPSWLANEWVGGLDPGQSDHMGLAVVSPCCTEIDLCSIYMASRSPVDGARMALAWYQRIPLDGAAHVLGDRREVYTLGIERPPAKVRSDVRHGPQADIGWKLGRVAGVVEGMGAAWCSIASVIVEVSEHRQTMVRFLADRGVYLATERGFAALDYPWRRGAAVLEREEGELVLRWVECGHAKTLPLHKIGDPPSACPDCAPKARKLTRAEAVRDDHKRRACEGVRSIWPEPYSRLVQEARARARKSTQPDHQVAGVADACEAVWVAVHVVTHGAA